MKIVIGFLSGLSAVCETYGTWTVWVNYKRTSTAAQFVVAEMHRVDKLEREYFSVADNHLLDQMNFRRDSIAERQEKNFVRSAFSEAMSPLLPDRVTNYGLFAFALGAALAFGATILALN